MLSSTAAVEITIIRRLRRAAQRLRNISGPRGIILLYHRVAESLPDPHCLCVQPSRFAEHLLVLREAAHPVRLQRFARRQRQKTGRNRIVAVTFDDGYADNLYNAKPLLEQYDIPATVFLTAGYIGQHREFWWDQVETLLLNTATLPDSLTLDIGRNSYTWDLQEPTRHINGGAHKPPRFWIRGDSARYPFTSRESCYRSVCSLLRSLPDPEVEQIIRRLWSWAGTKPKTQSTRRPLSKNEVLRLSCDGLIEIGAHSKTHPVLSGLPLTAQRDEIQQSKILLEDLLGRSITSFAYPHGSRSDYTRDTVGLVREAGFSHACTVLFDAVWPRTDHYQLPRVNVGDWDGETFARVIHWLLN